MKRMKLAAALVLAAFLLNAAGCAGKAGPSVSSSPVGSSSLKIASALPHSLGLSGVANARDLGGYRTSDGKTVKTGVLLRTAALHDATANDLNLLTGKYRLTQIIDFRSDKGATKEADPKISGVTNTSLPIRSGGKGEENKAYRNMVTEPTIISSFRQFFSILLNRKDGAILFHCAAGKDRTGIASMLLLSALGVDKDTVIQDYLLSNEYCASKECVKKEWALTAFNTIDSTYGSMDSFLSQQLGLTPQKRAKLRMMYLT